VNNIVRRHEVRSETGLNGAFGKRDAQVRFPDAGRAEQYHIARLVDEPQGPQFADLSLVDRRLEAEIELVEGL
jgi:hypothetical protein